MKKVLWVSPYAPYDNVKHAGGQIENYYLKGLCNDNNLELSLLSISYRNEYEDVITDLRSYNIENRILIREDILVEQDSCIYKFLQRYNKYAGMIDLRLWKAVERELREVNDINVIIVQWTEFVLFADIFVKMFPSSKLVLIEEDISFQKYYRRIKLNKSVTKKISWWVRYLILKKKEIDSLKNGTIIILNNDKDKKLIEKNGIKKTWRWSPYFNSLHYIDSNRVGSKDLLFFGAMGRYENYESCIWFIINVMPHLDGDYRFIILGSNPNEVLQKYASEKVIITGYVEDVGPYFEQALCFVAPLVIGAGIKIKIIEAMSSGLTVLTNTVGIEGIPAENNYSYVHCEKPEEYVLAINKLSKDSDLNKQIGENGRSLIDNTFNYATDLEQFKRIILDI